MLEVQKYLQTNTLADLQEEFGIKVREYPDRAVLNYCQINSAPHRFTPIVRECRSLILSLPDFSVLSRSFDRFYNHGEDPDTNDFPVKDSIIFEKLDGSLIPVYHDGAKWCVSSRSMAYAEGGAGDDGTTTFYEIFCKALGEDIQKAFEKANSALSYVFELTTPTHRVVKATAP